MRKDGMTITELLVSMAIFGTLMSGLLAFMTSNQKFSASQLQQIEGEYAASQSLLRMNDVVSLAAYIYPANRTLKVNGENYTTGKNALAVLLPEGNTYCPGTGEQYCAYLYAIEQRARHQATLGQLEGSTKYVLAEYQVKGGQKITWAVGKNPAIVGTNWPTAQVGLLTDDVNAVESSLGAFENLLIVDASAVPDFERTTFKFNDQENDSEVKIDAKNQSALIQASTVTLVVEKSSHGKANRAQQVRHMFARSAPRSSLPNVK